MFQCCGRQIFPTCKVEVPYVKGDILPNCWVCSVPKIAFNCMKVGAPCRPLPPPPSQSINEACMIFRSG